MKRLLPVRQRGAVGVAAVVLAVLMEVAGWAVVL